MTRYNIRIDGEVMPKSYSFEELWYNGVFDYDDLFIEVKQVSQSDWYNIKYYSFPEKNENKSINTSNKKENTSQGQYYINEFGEVVSRNNIGGGSQSSSNRNTPSSSYTSNQPSEMPSTPSANWGWILKLILTIVAIVIWIAILSNGNIGLSVTYFIGGTLLLLIIWNN